MLNLLFENILLVCDMDGTLLNSQSQVSKQNRSALEYFVERGGLFTIATGRMEKSIAAYLAILPVNVPAILYNGAMIYDCGQHRVLWQNCLTPEVGNIVNELLVRFPGLGIEVFNAGDVYFLQQNEETERHKIKEGFLPRSMALELIPKPWYKVLLAWKPEQLARVARFLQDSNICCRAVYSEPQFLELLHNSVSKGHALQKLIKILGRTNLAIVAMGDNLNDLEMIEIAGTGIAVENAHPALKKVAKRCCCHHNSHAVAQVIQWIEDHR